ncbi:MAG: FAD/NAD(P)-binding protein [Acidimicrobiia bacterium]|nr:FAD/NAD(P)-binding protein [Acidimicrobiia bacterium]
MVTLTEPAVIDQMTPIPFKVRSVREELSHTFTLELEPPNGDFDFQPGQFTMVYAFGIGEVPISISSSSTREATLLQTIRRTGAVTHALGTLKSGDYVGIRGPYGTPWPMQESKGRDLLIVGGGIGLAPLRPAIYHALENRDDYERVVVLYGTRTPDDILFETELRRWGDRTDITTLITVDAADRGWYGAVGVVTRLIGRVGFDPSNTTALVCGPEIMMTVTAERLMEGYSMEPSNIYVTMERNMKCGIGVCGHCQFGAKFICTDGAVFSYSEVGHLFDIKGV